LDDVGLQITDAGLSFKRRAKSRTEPRAIEAVHPYSVDGCYVNFMMDDGDDSRLKATFGDNYDRLVALKAKYDCPCRRTMSKCQSRRRLTAGR